MSELLSVFLWEHWQQHALWLMFFSAFLSSTILPGNSEVVFVTLALPIMTLNGIWSMELFSLLLIATSGNTLGSLTTYWLGRLLPQPLQNAGKNRRLWAMEKLQRYGALTLLLSPLPIIGDVLCAIAGYLRINWCACLLAMFIGKGVRYALLIGLSLPFGLSFN